jgi:iron complex transport system ATP-binding protein
LLKAICGDIPHSGSVSLGGTDLETLKPWQVAARRAVLPQASSLAFPFTVDEVVRIGLMSGIGAQSAARAETALARVGLAGFGGRPYHELSGGEQQRVQLARVLCQVWDPVVNGSPCWLILDEPVSSLDIAHQLDVMEIAQDYARRGGGVLAVMHDLNLTALYADCIAVLAQGRLIASGPTAQVMTDQVLSQAYGCNLRVNTTPSPQSTYILPHAASRSDGA